MVQTGETTPDGALDLYLLTGPIHTDIVLPVTPSVREAFSFLNANGIAIADPDVAWLIVGWGSRGFYTETGDYSDLKLATVARAITGDRSVIRLDVAGTGIPDAGLTRIPISQPQLAALTSSITASLARPIMSLDHPGFTDTDQFFPALGRFHLFKTCNVWVGGILRTAGLRVGIWTPFNWSLP